ncbi:MAG: MFS transporter [Ilumatobacter sp.]|uniref:MFS transporter n=1 Tax=Ilumatobacter sp. TaxID=1967498 RepID=UPI0032977986
MTVARSTNCADSDDDDDPITVTVIAILAVAGLDVTGRRHVRRRVRRDPRSTLSALTATDWNATAVASGAPDGTGFVDEPRPVATGMGGLWALFAGLALMMVGNGLNGAVIGIRSTAEGFSVLVTGVVMAGYFAGFLLAPSLVVPRIPKIGHIRMFAGLASTASSAVLIHSISVVPLTWTLMRFVFGFCMAGLYIVIESWLGEMTDASNRGRTLAIYMIVSMGGLGIGQYLVAIGDPSGFQLFVVSSVLVSMSLVPITLAATTRQPVVTVPEPVSIRELIGVVPTGVVGSFMSGSAAGILLGLGAVYAARIGLTIERTGFFLVAPTIGAIVFQWPIGRLSDKIPRRRVIFAVAVVGSAVAATMAVLPQGGLAVAGLMILLGGMMFPLYSLVVSYALDWTPDGKLVGASGTLIRINGAGALVGPLATAPLISGFGSQWFFWALSVVLGVIVVYVGFRIVFRETKPLERQREFIPFPARAGAMAINLVINPVRRAATKSGMRPPAGPRGDEREHPSPITSEIYDGPAPVSPLDGD